MPALVIGAGVTAIDIIAMSLKGEAQVRLLVIITDTNETPGIAVVVNIGLLIPALTPFNFH